jgi:hypothetical protein
MSSRSPGALGPIAAVSGSLVGALGSFASTCIAQRHQSRRDFLAKKTVYRETLYSDFITESARILVDACEHNVSDPKNLIPVYALLSCVRLASSPPVLKAAEEIVRLIVDTYPQPNLTAEQIQSTALSGEDPL